MDKECCGNCKFHYHDGTMFDGDYVCVNPESDYLSDYTDYEHSCEEHEYFEED